MALQMKIEATSGIDNVDYSEVADDLQEAFEALQKLPSNRAMSVIFPTSADAKLFVKQGQAWAADQPEDFTYTNSKGEVTENQGLTFYRLNKDGEVKANPTKVRFRIVVQRPSKTA